MHHAARHRLIHTNRDGMRSPLVSFFGVILMLNCDQTSVLKLLSHRHVLFSVTKGHHKGGSMFQGVFRPLLAAVIGLPIMFSVQGCTDDEVAAGLGVAAVVIGVAAIDKASDGHYRPYPPRRPHYPPPRRPAPRCRPGYREHCTVYRDRWGHPRRECRRIYDRCRHHYSANLAIPGLHSDLQPIFGGVQAEVESDTELQVAQVASHYSIGFDAAEALTGALSAAGNGDLKPVYDLGLTKEDLIRLGKMKMITDSGVTHLAQSLNLAEEDTKNLLNKILADLKEQTRDVESAYWQSCVQAKKWKTPQNFNCKETSWTGCSPKTGATLCTASVR